MAPSAAALASQISFMSSNMPNPAARPLLDPADVQRLLDFGNRCEIPLRHLILTGIAVLFHRHFELGPATITLDLSPDSPANSSLPNAAHFHCPIDSALPFSDIVKSIAAAEFAATWGSNGPRPYLPELLPYRILVTLPPGWGAILNESPAAPQAQTWVLSIAPSQGLTITSAEGEAPDLTVLTVFRRLRPLLESAIAFPGTVIGRLALTTPSERHELLIAWNATDSPLPTAPCAHHLFTAQAARTPDAIAIASEQATLTFRQLDLLTNDLAKRLQMLGAGPHSIVAACFDAGPERLIAFLSILKAGAPYLLLNPARDPADLAQMLRDSSAILLSDNRMLSRLPLTAPKTLLFDDLTAESESAPPCHASPETIAYIVYTRGIDGKLVGVQVRHRNLINALSAAADVAGLCSRDIRLSMNPSSLHDHFDASALDMLLPLSVGAKYVPVPRHIAIDGRRLRDLIQSSGATVVHAPASIWRRLIASGWQGTHGLRMLCGGNEEFLHQGLVRQLLSRGHALWTVYGPPETAGFATVHRLDGDSHSTSFGSPIANVRCYILDSHLQPVPIGMAGELFIAGAGVAAGYLNRPDLTDDRFLHDPFSVRPDSCMFRTGLLCRYQPDGTISHMGPVGGAAIDLRPASAKDTTLVSLRDAGEKLPLFCCPALGLPCAPFGALLEYLDSEQPLLGFDFNNDSSVCAAADRVLLEIKSVQPSGPYHLVGFSSGGLVAYEVARRLADRGDEVAIVVMLDTFGPGYPVVQTSCSRFLNNVRKAIFGPHAHRRTAILNCFQQLSPRIRSVLRRLGLSLPPMSTDRDWLSVTAPSRDYVFGPYSGRVALFRAIFTPDWSGTSFANIHNGWDKVVSSKIDVHPFPCSHWQFFDPDQVCQWAQDLRDLLNHVRAGWR